MDLNKLYKINSQPLEAADSIVIGEEYCTEEGVTIKYIDVNNVEIVRASPLNDGEFITELNSKLLNLFWKLRSKGAIDR